MEINPGIIGKEKMRKIENIRVADILVGIPSYNNARTIVHVIQSVQTGLSKSFPGMKSVIVNADGGSTDGTADIVQTTAGSGPEVIPVYLDDEYTLKNSALSYRTILEIADALKVKACAIVSADLQSITPEWTGLLIDPVMSGKYDYVAPLYYKHKYDGTINKNIIYPLTRALYGKRVRQPLCREVGFSGELARFYLEENIWERDFLQHGIDIWITTSAITHNFRTCQSFLGAEIRKPRNPGADLSSLLYHLVGSTFEIMETYSPAWSKISGSEELPTFGSPRAVRLEPVFINLDRMIERFKLGVADLMDIWKSFFPGEIVNSLRNLKRLQRKDFSIPDDLWARIIYSFAVASQRKLFKSEHLLKSLTPLYLGKVASFVLEIWESTSFEVEERIEQLCEAFENEKKYLVTNWGLGKEK
jgi:glycosyltransferase involved in cell wall biosynthesis